MRRSVEPLLATIVDIVLRHCDPDEIVLFGSWAKGTTHRNSDIDILVIGPFTSSVWLRDREVREALRDLPVTVDIHLLTPEEIVIGAANPHSYLNTLFMSSRCLYRRP